MKSINLVIAFFCLLIGLPIGLFINARAQEPAKPPVAAATPPDVAIFPLSM